MWSMPRIRPLPRHLSVVKAGALYLFLDLGWGKGQELGQHGPPIRCILPTAGCRIRSIVPIQLML